MAGWRNFADQHGTTVAALLEVIGVALAAGAPHHHPPRRIDLELVAVAARDLSAARRRRRPDPLEDCAGDDAEAPAGGR